MFLLGRPQLGTHAHYVEHVLRWPIGVARVVWHRLLPGGPTVHRSETRGDGRDLPLPVPPELRDPLIQYVADGVGDLLHRRYAVVVDGPERGPQDVIARFGDEPNCIVPEVAVFERTRGGPGPLAPGDEFLIRMPAPWDGPVRVIATSPTSVRLATLRGHLESGQIEFRARTDAGGALHFEIESWARPGDRLSDLLYNRLWLAKGIQMTVWAQTCIGVINLVGGTARDGVSVETRRLSRRQVARGGQAQPPTGV